MTTKNYLIITILLFISLNGFTQQAEEVKKRAYDIIETKNLKKQNLLIIDFMIEDSRFRLSNKAKEILKSNSNWNIDKNNPTFDGKAGVYYHTIFLDNSEILGLGVNRVYNLNQLRVSDFENMYVSLSAKEIHLYSKEK